MLTGDVKSAYYDVRNSMKIMRTNCSIFWNYVSLPFMHPHVTLHYFAICYSFYDNVYLFCKFLLCLFLCHYHDRVVEDTQIPKYYPRFASSLYVFVILLMKEMLYILCMYHYENEYIFYRFYLPLNALMNVMILCMMTILLFFVCCSFEVIMILQDCLVMICFQSCYILSFDMILRINVCLQKSGHILCLDVIFVLILVWFNFNFEILSYFGCKCIPL